MADTAQIKETQLPEWEHIAAGKNTENQTAGSTPQGSLGYVLGTKLDRILPPHRKYVGLSRRTFLWTILAVTLALFVLVIGLAVGLSRGSRCALR